VGRRDVGGKKCSRRLKFFVSLNGNQRARKKVVAQKRLWKWERGGKMDVERPRRKGKKGKPIAKREIHRGEETAQRTDMGDEQSIGSTFATPYPRSPKKKKLHLEPSWDFRGMGLWRGGKGYRSVAYYNK